MPYPLLTLSNISLGFKSKILFNNIKLNIQADDKIGLIGRNGSGKSSLLRIIAGDLVPDSGDLFLKPGTKTAYLNQQDDLTGYNSLGDYIFEGISEKDFHKKEKQLSGLRVDLNLQPSQSSGGEKRRASLLKTLLAESDILLLDEPTNHLDIPAIEFLEKHLATLRKALILISHDKRFLENLTEQMLWLDRGDARVLPKGFSYFEDWRDKVFALELAEKKKLDKKIKREKVWAVEGISARRKRNQRRLRELDALRKQRQNLASNPKALNFNFAVKTKASKVLIEVKNLNKSFDNKRVVRDFSFTLQKGDRIAIVGANGVGKTTLINLFLEKVRPDSGVVKLAETLKVAFFEQNKDQVATDASILNFVSNNQTQKYDFKTGYMMVQGKPCHIITYLKEFLFTRAQIFGPVSELSGGEKSRLFLAIMMAKKSNLLVLDEPTNDLDLETLDLFKEQLSLYPGTILFVSHDRDFIDSIATHTFVLAENHPVTVHAGGISDFRNGLSLSKKDQLNQNIKKPKIKKTSASRSQNNNKIDQKISLIQEKINLLNFEIKRIEDFLSNEDLYSTDKKKFLLVSKELSVRRTALLKAEDEWIYYEEKKIEI